MSFFVILFQVIALLATSAGFACWIKLLFRQRWIKNTATLLGAGFAAAVIVLQFLVYLDIRLAIGSWAIVAAGLAGFAWESMNFLRNRSALRRRDWRHLGAVAVVFLGIFALQGSGLLFWGPGRYYAGAHYDHANYISIAQFLTDRKFSTDFAHMGPHPYLFKGIQYKTVRIGASIANGYLAVVTGGDAQSTYGTVSVFFLCLLGCCIYEMLRSFGISNALSLLGGIWSACLPCITKVHIDSFFSQEAVFFVFPALVCIFRNFRHRPRPAFVLATILLAYLLGAYTELFVFGALYCFFLPFVCVKGGIRHKALFAIAVIIAALAIDPLCTKYVYDFIKDQYKIAADATFSLESIFPLSGTFRGWVESLFGYELRPRPMQRVTLMAAAMLFAGFSAFFSRQLRRRAELSIMVITYASALLWLISKPVFLKYPFTKILDSFAPVTLAVILIGAARLTSLLATKVHYPRSRKLLHSWFTPVCLLPFFVVSLHGSYLEMREIIRHPVVNTDNYMRIYGELEKTHGKTLSVFNYDTLVVAWMAYHGRHNDIYISSGRYLDLVIEPRRGFIPMPYGDPSIKIVTDTGIFSMGDILPQIAIDNPQGIDEDKAGGTHWYWIKDVCVVQITRFDTTPGKFNLTFDASAGPANTSPSRIVSIAPEDEDSKSDTRSFENKARLSFPLELKPGVNRFNLKVTGAGAPDRQRQPADDTRGLVLRVENFQIQKMPAQQ